MEKTNSPNRLLRESESIRCHCANCPSYPQKNDPRVYCEYGKSGYAIKRQGCLCSACPIWEENHFSGHYYCEGGKDPASKI
jgi:hypothetical protein